MTLSLSQAEVRELSALIRATRRSDELTWDSLSWIVVHTGRIDILEFQAEPDLGWPSTVAQRTQLRSNGYENGLLSALHEMWTGEPEPSFSESALRLLHASARVDPPEVFVELAEELEGAAGAAYARQILDDAVSVDQAGGVTDDEAAVGASPPEEGGRVD
ncbi:hypothetical protein ACFFOS_13225 [Nocardioides kongjuensis]|uniref:Uncharacterized protein n=1 Tax=Nocardioides kongjuensis TaxID=349522 RepID=A0A852RUX6_9ACTN|nr:hypothetical protein [Nocardioides kongjuensis]NYD32680.1 hypothetical protein [Nocardioides kongjuensis]